MKIQPVNGECAIRPGPNGLTFVIQPERELTFPSRTSHWKAMFIGLVVLIAAVAPHTIHAATYSANDIISDTNAARTSRNIAPLTTNAALTAAAMAKANDMFAKQYFNHVSPTGTQPWSFITAQGYVYTAAGENLAIDFIDAQDVVTAWLNSPEHRSNLLSTKYRDIGVAVVDGVLNGQTTTIVVQFFASQKAISTPVTSTVTKTVTPQPVTTTVLPTPAPTPTTPTVHQVTQQSQPEALPNLLLNSFATVDLIPAFAHPSVAGTETSVIHSPTKITVPVSNVASSDPQVTLLVVTTLASYLALLSTLLSLRLPIWPRNLALA